MLDIFFLDTAKPTTVARPMPRPMNTARARDTRDAPLVMSTIVSAKPATSSGESLVGEGQLEREGRQHQAGGAGHVSREREAAEAADQLSVQPQIGHGDQSPEEQRVRMEEQLDEVGLAREFLARLVPAPDESEGDEGQRGRRCMACPRLDVAGVAISKRGSTGRRQSAGMRASYVPIQRPEADKSEPCGR